jgi:hypothetical protein
MTRGCGCRGCIRTCLRHTFVTTMLDAGVDLRDVQIAARHADPRTTMRYDRARKNLDRHPNYLLAAYMALRHLTMTCRAEPSRLPSSEPLMRPKEPTRYACRVRATAPKKRD